MEKKNNLLFSMVMLVFFISTQSPAFGDPLLTWNTFLGGSLRDDPGNITVDNTGNVYVSNTSWGSWGTPVRAYTVGGAYGIDAVVSKVNSATGALLWNTFLGGNADDSAGSVTVDSSGNIYVTGGSWSPWGSPVNPFIASSENCFIAKLDGSTGAVLWNTFLGGTSQTFGTKVVVSRSGNIYVVGNTTVSWGSPVNAFAGNYDVFVARLDSSGALQWNTFLGCSDTDWGTSIAIDESENVSVAGSSSGTWGIPVNPFSGTATYNGFVARLNGTSGAVQWNTFVAGGEAKDIALDASGNLYAAGSSWTSWGSPVNAFAGGSGMDGYAAKIEGATGALLWNTFFGCNSNNHDTAYGIALDVSGNVYVSGSSPATWGTPLYAFGSGSCAFVVKLNGASGVRQWNTFLGSSDAGRSISLDNSGRIYVTGEGYISWGTPVNPFIGSGAWISDIFVAKLTPSDIPSTSTTTVAVETTTTSADTTTIPLETTTTSADTTTIPLETTTTTSADASTTIPPDTTTTTADKTTTTTTKPGICPFKKLVADKETIQTLRTLRDNKIDTVLGAVLSAMYYRDLEEIAQLLNADKNIVDQFIRLNADYKQVLRCLVSSGRATVTAGDVRKITCFLKALQNEASPILNNDLQFVINGMEQGWLLQWFNVTIDSH